MRRTERQKASSQTPTRTSVRSYGEGGGRGWKRREKESEGGWENNGPFRVGQMKGAAGAEVKGWAQAAQGHRSQPFFNHEGSE